MSETPRSSKRTSVRKRAAPEVLTYASEALTSPEAAVKKTRTTPKRPSSSKGTPAKASSGKKAAGGSSSKKAVAPLHRVVERPSNSKAHALVGSCVQIDWPSGDDNSSGMYTAMIIKFDAKKGTHLVFYYQTATSTEATEDVNLYNGSRYWESGVAPRGRGSDMQETIPGLTESSKRLGTDVRDLIGRRIGVEWPFRGRLKFSDAVIVDYRSGTPGPTFQLVYQKDDFIEIRDLVTDEQRWRLYPVVEAAFAAPTSVASTGLADKARHQVQRPEQGRVLWQPASSFADFQRPSASAVAAPTSSSKRNLPDARNNAGKNGTQI